MTRLPLYNALNDYLSKKNIPFYTSGHKMGKSISKNFLKTSIKNLLQYDLTELDGLDNLHEPEGVIKEAQELAAKAYKADYTFFLINGSTVGNQAMIMSVCNNGDKIIIPENSHKSVLNALILSGANPIYIPCKWNKKLGVTYGFDINKLEEELKKDSSIKAVFVTNPNYYGFCVDLKKIVEIAHKYNKPVLVDEAHGAHFNFHNNLPLSAISCGADMVVQSTHKTLSALAQGSMLHLKSKIINKEKVKSILNILQSSSPSYLLMLFLDFARFQMVTEGEKLLTNLLNLIDDFKDKTNNIKGLYCYDKSVCKNYDIYDYDPTKIIIDFSELGLSGFTAIDILNDEFNIQAEMSTMFNIMSLASIGNNKKDFEKLLTALKKIAINYKKSNVLEDDFYLAKPKIPKTLLSPREAFFAKKTKVLLKDSIGKICAETISPYPPGIPIISFGQEINSDIIEYLKFLETKKYFIDGIEDNSLKTIKIVLEE